MLREITVLNFICYYLQSGVSGNKKIWGVWTFSLLLDATGTFRNRLIRAVALGDIAVDCKNKKRQLFLKEVKTGYSEVVRIHVTLTKECSFNWTLLINRCVDFSGAPYESFPWEVYLSVPLPFSQANSARAAVRCLGRAACHSPAAQRRAFSRQRVCLKSCIINKHLRWMLLLWGPVCC